MRSGQQVDADEKTEINHVKIRRGIPRKIVEETLGEMAKTQEKKSQKSNAVSVTASSKNVEIKKMKEVSVEEGSMNSEAGLLLLPEELRLLNRMKYLTEGAALGSKSFIKAVYAQYREIFGRLRKVDAKLVAEPDSKNSKITGIKPLYSIYGKSLGK